jgi:hypothetical protein
LAISPPPEKVATPVPTRLQTAIHSTAVKIRQQWPKLLAPYPVFTLKPHGRTCLCVNQPIVV